MFELPGKYTTAKVMIDSGVEESCIAQIMSFTNHPAFTNPIAIMSDCHTGKGSCVGFTMRMTPQIIPAVVGVDIGCGLQSEKTNAPSTVPLEEIERRIRKRVPFGQEVREGSALHMKNEFPWHVLRVLAEKFCRAYNESYDTYMSPPAYDMNWFEGRVKALGANMRWVINSLV